MALEQFIKAFPGNRTFTAAELAAILGITDITIRNWEEAGVFPGALRVSVLTKLPLPPGGTSRTELVIPGNEVCRAAQWFIPQPLQS